MNIVHACQESVRYNYNFANGQIALREDVLSLPSLAGSISPEQGHDVVRIYSISEYIIADALTIIFWLIFNGIVIYGLFYVVYNWNAVPNKKLDLIPAYLGVCAYVVMFFGVTFFASNCVSYSYTSDTLIVSASMFITSYLPLVYVLAVVAFVINHYKKCKIDD